MLQFYIPEVVSVEQIFDEADKVLKSVNFSHCWHWSKVVQDELAKLDEKTGMKDDPWSTLVLFCAWQLWCIQHWGSVTLSEINITIFSNGEELKIQIYQKYILHWPLIELIEELLPEKKLTQSWLLVEFGETKIFSRIPNGKIERWQRSTSTRLFRWWRRHQLPKRWELQHPLQLCCEVRNKVRALIRSYGTWFLGPILSSLARGRQCALSW